MGGISNVFKVHLEREKICTHTHTHTHYYPKRKIHLIFNSNLFFKDNVKNCCVNYKKSNEDKLSLKDIKSNYKKKEIKACNNPAIH